LFSIYVRTRTEQKLANFLTLCGRLLRALLLLPGIDMHIYRIMRWAFARFRRGGFGRLDSRYGEVSDTLKKITICLHGSH